MKAKLFLFFLLAVTMTTFSQGNKEPWTKQQLMEPADLAKKINSAGSQKPYIFCIGPQAGIKGSIDIGSTMSKANLDKLKEQLAKLPKNASIVIYCGCCPFAVCPNIRPAFELLNKMQFTNHRLLNLPHNLKVDWIDPGYPTIE